MKDKEVEGDARSRTAMKLLNRCGKKVQKEDRTIQKERKTNRHKDERGERQRQRQRDKRFGQTDRQKDRQTYTTYFVLRLDTSIFS